jgi:hypothetical protein
MAGSLSTARAPGPQLEGKTEEQQKIGDIGQITEHACQSVKGK